MTTTVYDIEKRLGIPGLFTRGLYDKYGPQWAARKLLQVIWIEENRKPQILRETTFDLRDLPFNQAAYDIVWRRELEPWMIGCYCHHVDKNSQYLAADKGMYTGIGDPIHLHDGDDGTYIEPKLPGIYRVEWKIRDSFFDGTNYPYIIKPGQEWVTKDVLLFARKNGYDVTIHEAWAFTDYTRVLDEWARRLWEARVALKQIDAQAYGKIKWIATAGNGAWNWQDRSRTSFIHPNWWADTVGKARLALLANLATYGAPVLIETDGLYYITHDPDPRTAILSIDKGVTILARETECGGYKHQGSFQVTKDIYEKAQGLNPGQLAECFKEACDAA